MVKGISPYKNVYRRKNSLVKGSLKGTKKKMKRTPEKTSLQERKKKQEHPRTRCSTHRVIEILEKVNKQNIHSLDSIGFGGITQVKLTRLSVDFAQWALDHYDVESRSYLFNEGRRLQIGEQDVRRVYGLPNDNKLIVLENVKPTMKKCAVDMRIPNSKKGKGSMELTLLKEKLIQENDIDLWRKYFILYCLGGLLCPNSHPVANLHYLPLICKLQSKEFREYSWCTHIEKWFNDGMVEAKKKGNWICADLHLLLVCFSTGAN